MYICLCTVWRKNSWRFSMFLWWTLTLIIVRDHVFAQLLRRAPRLHVGSPYGINTPCIITACGNRLVTPGLQSHQVLYYYSTSILGTTWWLHRTRNSEGVWQKRRRKELKMPGYLVSGSIFINPGSQSQWETYLCPKCDLLLRDAVQPSCGHWLCQTCAEELFQSATEER